MNFTFLKTGKIEIIIESQTSLQFYKTVISKNIKYNYYEELKREIESKNYRYEEVNGKLILTLTLQNNLHTIIFEKDFTPDIFLDDEIILTKEQSVKYLEELKKEMSDSLSLDDEQISKNIRILQICREMK